jgi:hypothetical protein
MTMRYASRLDALERVFGRDRVPTPAEIANARRHLELGHALPPEHPGLPLARYIAEVLAAMDRTFDLPTDADACLPAPPAAAPLRGGRAGRR